MGVKGKILQPRMAIEKPKINYRELGALNQSMIALFDENPVKFFREFKMGDPRKQADSTAIKIGDLVDFMLLECNMDEECFESRFDERFALMDGIKGSGQVFELADELFDLTLRDTQKGGEITGLFESRFDEAVIKLQGVGKYKGKTKDKILEDFEKNGKDYLKARLENIGKTIVDTSVIDKARTVAQGLRGDIFTSSVFIQREGEDYLPHFPIEWNYKLDSERFIPCKGEIDLLKINHEEEVIDIYDLKTTYDNESFQYSYIKNYYYLQATFYWMAVHNWKMNNGVSDYTINYMKFVVGDTSSNNRRPLVYITDVNDYLRGEQGFVLNRSKYRGIDELIREIAWCEETGIWNCSKESYDNKGQIQLNIQYD